MSPFGVIFLSSFLSYLCLCFGDGKQKHAFLDCSSFFLFFLYFFLFFVVFVNFVHLVFLADRPISDADSDYRLPAMRCVVRCAMRCDATCSNLCGFEITSPLLLSLPRCYRCCLALASSEREPKKAHTHTRAAAMYMGLSRNGHWWTLAHTHT